MSTYTVDHARRPARRCSPRSASRSLEELFDRQIPAGVRLRRALDLPAGMAEQDVYAHLRALAARNTSRRGRDHLPRRRDVRPLRPGGHRHAHGALGVPDAVHALPARDLPGRPAGDVRVPDGDQRADRRCRSPTRRVYEGPSAVARRRLPGQARQRQAAGSSSRAACTRTPRDAAHAGAPATATRSSRSPLRDGVTDPDALGRGDRPGHERGHLPAAELPRRGRGRRRARGRGQGLAGASSSAPTTRSRWAILKPPGECGVDVAVGEGQTLGNRLDFGGPSFGFFAATEAYLRRMPGPHRRRDARRRRPPRLRAHAADARAAHPPREGDLATSAPRRRSTRWPASST